MHSQSDRQLLAHLGGLYGSGMLLNGLGARQAATSSGIDGHDGADSPSPALPAALVRIPIADAPITDTVLDDPRKDAGAQMTVRRRVRGQDT